MSRLIDLEEGFVPEEIEDTINSGVSLSQSISELAKKLDEIERSFKEIEKSEMSLLVSLKNLKDKINRRYT